MKILHNSKPAAKSQRAAMQKKSKAGRDLRVKPVGHCGGCRKLMFVVIDFGQQPLSVAISDPEGYNCAACGHKHTADKLIARCLLQRVA